MDTGEGNIGRGAKRESRPDPAQPETLVRKPDSNDPACQGTQVEAAARKSAPLECAILKKRGNSFRGNRDVPRVPDTGGASGRPEKGNRASGMYARGKSDGCIVPKKPPNNGERSSPAEVVGGRRPTEGNVSQTAAHRTQSRARVSIGLRRVREAGRLRLCAITRGKGRVREIRTHTAPASGNGVEARPQS